jgi:hypothetical protein
MPGGGSGRSQSSKNNYELKITTSLLKSKNVQLLGGIIIKRKYIDFLLSNIAVDYG